VPVPQLGMSHSGVPKLVDASVQEAFGVPPSKLPSATASTALVTVAVLLPGGSKTSPETATVLVAATQAPPVNSTVMVQVAEAPLFRLPTFQVQLGAANEPPQSSLR